MNEPAKYYRLMEVEVSGTKAEFALPQDAVFQKAKSITAVEAFPVGSLSVGPITGSPVVNNTVFNKSTLVLQTTDSIDRITDVPLQRINPGNNNGQAFRIEIPPLNVTKCKIRVGNTTGLVPGEVFVIGFWYEM